MNTVLRKMLLLAVIATASLIAAGCGGVEGNTYQAEGGLAQIEFQSGGKANVSLGPMKMSCTYIEESKSVTLTCAGDKTVFAIRDDGALIPPPGNMIGPLTKKK